VGIKMLLLIGDIHIETWISLLFIGLVLVSSVVFSLRRPPVHDAIEVPEELPPLSER
jgi:hypothetical protein